jgi:hemerythrin
MTPDLEHHSQSDPHLIPTDTDDELMASGLLPRKQELHDKFINTLQNVLPHLGKDESKIVSALIILALKLEGIIGKDISEKDSKLIEILKQMIIENEDKKESAIKIAERLMRTKDSH